MVIAATHTVVKSGNVARRPFGQGILPNPPVHRAPASISDMEWATQAFGAVDAGNEPVALTDAELDQAAEWAAAADRLERGLCC